MMHKKITIIVISIMCLMPMTSPATQPLPHRQALAQFSKTLEEIEAKRASLHTAYQQAKNTGDRNALHRKAEQYIVDTFYTKIAPAWLGMPWTMAIIDDGLQPDARFPHEKGKGISCSWFVVSTLQNLGLKLGNPRGFAGTIAVHLQKSLSPEPKDFKRFFHISPAELKKKFIHLGDGLYIIGLNCHVGFVHVEGDRVTFVHSDYTSPMQVVMDPLESSEAIELSMDTGYVVSALFKDNRLIHHWLTGTKVYFSGPRK